ncbi:uncharacterized protein CTRU02_208439 [Colletotrichum truncatum]|uniref:Uncharacterized protein n=1 Tax=Colletotrichum truncatum TaxID=5467 RepID=A0ACC3YWB5_COLTU|nr:uncharacterized protein CTRU02_10192 [Colletotrichum truncatum]KAF6787396.1 hypothetical protein CTRU02_10192 [Colletotrichum truncatum]
MDHNRAAPNQFGARPNRRASAQFTVDQEGRKPLFSKPSRESLGAGDNAQPSSGANRYGYSPTNARPPSRAAGIPRPPSSASPRPPSRAAIPRPSSSLSQTPSIGSNQSAEVASPGSRLPRPKSTIGVFAKGKIPSVADVWQLAGEEDRMSPLDRVRRTSPAIDGSPSPAPRPYINRRVSDEAKVRQTFGKDAVDYSRPRPLSRLSSDSLRDSYVSGRYGGSPGSQQSASSSGSFTRRLSQYEREMDQSQPENLFSSTKIGPNIAETGRTLARKTSNSSLNGGQSLGRKASNSSLNGSSQSLGRRTSYGSLSASPRPGAFAKSSVPEGWIKHLLDQDEKGVKRNSMAQSDWQNAADTPIPSIEALEPTPPTSRPASTNPETKSPEKSYAWQLDADFTAGDLQISDSPRIRMGGTGFEDASNRRLSTGSANGEDPEFSPFRREPSFGLTPSRATRSNTKIDEIRQREEKANEQLAESRRSQSRARNNRLEEIREREAEAEEELARTKAQSRSFYPTPEDLPILEEDDDIPAMKEQARPKNTKLDTIRAREAESLSKRALAESRLEEIREQNSMFRDPSPEAQPVEEPIQEPIVSHSREPRLSLKEDRGERIANTPVTIYRKSSISKATELQTENESARNELASFQPPSRPLSTHTRTDSRDLLQRLARATSSSPASSPASKPASQPADIEKAVEAVKIDKLENVERPDNNPIEERPKSRVGEKAKLNVEERFRQHNQERLARREPETSGQSSVENKDDEKPAKEEQASNNAPLAKEPEKTTEAPSRKPYAWRRRSEDRPKTTEPEQKVDVSTRNQKDDSKDSKPTDRLVDPQPSSKDEAKAQEAERPKSAGLRRERRQRSTDSTKDSRKSVAMSDGDPTDRIEQEMKLFAPADNQSERGGSTRAPSAEPLAETDDKDLLADETPRPLKVDPLSLPTPKVTGAYVETPATVRVDRLPDEEAKPAVKSETKSFTSLNRSTSSRRSSRASSRARSNSKATESGSETSDQKEQEKGAAGTTTTSTLRRRKSIPRSRRPLINSVKPPTVKDDLLELQRIHQIEDSTLDDLEELFNLQRLPSPDIESMLDEISIKREEVATKPDITKTERDQTLEQIDRMSKTLKDGLLNIRSAKQGIERLEDKVSHAEGKYKDLTSITKSEQVVEELQEQQIKSALRPHLESSHKGSDRAFESSSAKVNVIQLPVPHLIQRNPFRITSLGIICILLSIWYIAESAMCEIYCRPTTCSTTPCVWSSTDPTWGVALPVKIDEWATNGWGRQVAHQLSEDVSDLWADAQDFITGTDITTIDISTLDFYGKRQLRRRLRKHGLKKPPTESAEDKAKWDAWHAARVASERVQDAREMGYDISEEDESMGDDEAV